MWSIGATPDQSYLAFQDSFLPVRTNDWSAIESYLQVCSPQTEQSRERLEGLQWLVVQCCSHARRHHKCPGETEFVQIVWPIIPVVSQCQLVLSTAYHLSYSWAYARTLHLSKNLADRYENFTQFGQRDVYAGTLCLGGVVIYMYIV